MVMAKKLTKLQSEVLELAKTQDLAHMTYREMAEAIGIKHPYSIQQAVNSLIVKELLTKRDGKLAISPAGTQYKEALDAMSTESIAEELQDSVLMFIGTGPSDESYTANLQSLLYWAGAAANELRKSS